jgi:DNA-binding winged helix-turn-helix (wHTH) protein/Tol biopolymer transport system component
MGNRALRMLSSESMGNHGGESQLDSKRRFGVFELDLRGGELWRNGVRVKLQEQPFQVLALLLERPGEVVTRDDLRNRLWPADTFVDFDHGLNAAIKRLRSALGDSADNPTFVETVARRGYRFLAPVGIGHSNGNHTAPAPAPTVLAPARRRPWWIIGAVSSIFLVLLGLGIGFLLANRAPTPPKITRLTANPLDDPVRSAAISRDGRYLAFCDDNGLYLREIETGETHPVSLPDGTLTTSVSWFPDNTHLLVSLSAQDGTSSVWEVSTLGGAARKLIDEGASAAVSPDGRSIAFIAGKTLKQRLWVADSNGERNWEVAGQDGEFFGRITWSPDNAWLAFTSKTVTSAKEGRGTLNIVKVERSTAAGQPSPPTQVLALDNLDAALAWAPDGRLIYCLAEPRPRQLDANLWSTQLDANMQPDGPPLRLTNDTGFVFSVSISGDNKRIVYTKGIPEPDVYVAGINPGGSIEEPQRLTMDDHQDIPYDWTIDNKSVLFISDRTGTFNIYKQAIDQTVPDLLVSSSQHSQLVRLSPDGTQILYEIFSRWGDPDYEVPLMRIPLAGGSPQQIVRTKFISNHQCSRAPSSVCLYSVVRGKSLIFFSFDPLRGPGKQVFELNDDTPQLYNWTLSPDATTLAIAAAKWGDPTSDIRLISLHDGSQRTITVHDSRGIGAIDWAADSKGLWAVTNGQKENLLLHIDLQGNARVAWHPKDLLIGWAIPSRDGKHLAINVRSMSANAWMLDHE